MKRKLSQTGVGGIGLLLVLATVLLLGGIGVVVYSKNQAKKPANSSETTVTPDGTSTSPNGIPGGVTGPPAPSPTSQPNTVKVTAVGMQINVPDSLKDLTYSTSAANGTTLITFSTKALTVAVPACAAANDNGAFSTITRGTGTYPGPANPSSGGLLKQYDGYYFAYTLPTGPCAKGLSVEQQNLLNSLAQDFYSSLGSVQAL